MSGADPAGTGAVARIRWLGGSVDASGAGRSAGAAGAVGASGAGGAAGGDLRRVLLDGVLPDEATVLDPADPPLVSFADGARAVQALLALRDRADAEAERTGEPCWPAAGIHQARGGRPGTGLASHDVSVAARIADVAGPGEVLLSATLHATLAAAVPGVRFEPVGPLVIRGWRAPVPLVRASRR